MINKLSTLYRLGICNIFRVFRYRLGVKTGLNPVRKLTAKMPEGQFFSITPDCAKVNNFPKTLQAFGYFEYPLTNGIPNWFYSPLTQHKFQNSHLAWYKIPDFDANVGDIKGVWEASRFDWVLNFILQAQQRNDEALHVLDAWLNDWCQKNSAYLGPNWKCGQEASIRVMHLIAGLIGLNQLTQPSKNIQELIALHLKRIAPTIDYAIAQDNNHGTSEATALFIGGAILNSVISKPEYKAWQDLGRKWLENRAAKLIMQDGGFSQYSVTYHRVMLDSYCLAEIIRQKLSLPKFSQRLYTQMEKATDWLYILTQQDGDTPNLGANDGAKLLPICETDYRDFRPTVQLASTLFCQHSYYAESGNYDETLKFFGINKVHKSDSNLPNKNVLFDSSGFLTAENSSFFIAFKLPVFKFRPSQCDALHLDVWWKGQNILRDGGTYSYNSTLEDLEYFSGVASHNTVQFDGHQQMPRLSRFLFAAWLKPSQLNYQPDQFHCAYQDYWGCKHKREVALKDQSIQVTDTISGFKTQAVLRWRLQPDQWQLQDNVLSNGHISIVVHSESKLTLQLVQGEESRYYYQKQSLPVLEIKTTQATSITTVIQDLT
ncbi:weeF [Acinetobacter sp. RF15A]|uniref:heparinase II/III domain-containing protein n=1 Tax=unclassified Acinetobacter TaxID=196816 RepID=UPI00119643D8|nr:MULTISPECIES: heparinase II/III family protein [unclassified Acinetobacter]TSH76961.1 weeF [Acinetobacter sp. RF15A]TSI18403.1 weeF [Acinetobacter sp. RF15B]